MESGYWKLSFRLNRRLRPLALATALASSCFLAPAEDMPQRPPVRWTATTQTGLADCFQLTLGGMFGRGPAWQSRFESGLSNLWSPGDSLYLYGAESLDLDATRSDWQSGVGYRRPVLNRSRYSLTSSFGFQHWEFANVLRGTRDWLTYENLTWRSRHRPFALTVTADSWSLLRSPLPRGTLLHTQVWMEHPFWSRDTAQIAVRHGPAHTYSWGFYGTQGHRVVRYQTALSLAVGATRLEFGFRQQLGLQPRIPDNRFWHFLVSRSFTLK